MSFKRGLIGLFSLLFLLSSISIVTLILDDKKDLSSRASIGVSQKIQETLGEVVLSSGTSTFQKIIPALGDINFTYSQSDWISPSSSDKDIVFLNRRGLLSVRFLPSSETKNKTVDSLLDDNFIFVKKNRDFVSQSGWKIIESTFKFLGQNKVVQFWTKDKYSLLVVSSGDIPLADVDAFASGISVVSNKVRGVSTSQDSSARLAALTRPSVVLILTNYCSAIKIGNIPGAAFSGKQYLFCLSATGSGFFVNSDGHIATNGHVVQIGPQTTLIAAVGTGQLNDLLIDFTEAYLAQMGASMPRSQIETRVKESIRNKESLYQMAGALEQLRTSNLLGFASGEYKYFVQVGQTPIQISKTNGVNTGYDILPAKLIGYDYQEVDPKIGFTSSDVALIKVEGKSFPALPLGSIEDITTGSELQVIGFPGVVGGNNSFLLDTSANAEPTVTKGVVSAIKKAKGDQKNLIQTDASINHGNSGGPALDKDGKVIGIATYGLMPEDGGGNYNFLRDVADLKSIMEKYNVTSETGETYNTWKSGLDNFWLSYYKYAQADFTKVKSSYEAHPTVEKYLSEAKAKANTTEDKTPIFSRKTRNLFIAISGFVMVVSLIAIISLLILEKIELNKKRGQVTSTPQKPIPPVESFS